MSPYEITHPGGSVEHMNEEAGAMWMHRVDQHLSRDGMAQPGAGKAMGLFPKHKDASSNW